MKNMLFPCILLLTASLSSGGQNHATETGESARILALENLWNQAELKRDARALELLLANTFVYTDSDGSFMNRTQWLAHVKRGDDHYEQLGNEGQVVQLYGDAAVVTGAYRERIKLAGKTVVQRGRFTDTWVKQGGEWKCVASQATPSGP